MVVILYYLIGDAVIDRLYILYLRRIRCIRPLRLQLSIIIPHHLRSSTLSYFIHYLLRSYRLRPQPSLRGALHLIELQSILEIRFRAHLLIQRLLQPAIELPPTFLHILRVQLIRMGCVIVIRIVIGQAFGGVRIGRLEALLLLKPQLTGFLHPSRHDRPQLVPRKPAPLVAHLLIPLRILASWLVLTVILLRVLLDFFEATLRGMLKAFVALAFRAFGVPIHGVAKLHVLVVRAQGGL